MKRLGRPLMLPHTLAMLMMLPRPAASILGSAAWMAQKCERRFRVLPDAARGFCRHINWPYHLSNSGIPLGASLPAFHAAANGRTATPVPPDRRAIAFAHGGRRVH